MNRVLVAVAVLALLGLHPAADGQRFSEWSAPVNLGPTLNTAYTEAGVFITRDGLSLYFSSDRPGGAGNLDLWVSERARVEDSWGAPRNLGSVINTTFSDTTPAVSVDGHWMFFASNRTGGVGDLDLYVSRRHTNRDNLGWQTPVNLGEVVNSMWSDRGPTLLDDEATGTYTVYFSSTRRPEAERFYEDIWASTLQRDGTFGPPVRVAELNSETFDNVPAIRKDGLEIFFSSQRGHIGNTDIWVSTRESTLDPWSEPKSLGPIVNSDVLDFRPGISFDGTALYFHSARDGGFGGYDLYVAKRTKNTGRDK
jgi:hypothetical protein